MKFNFDWKKLLPHGAAILVFLVLTAAYMSPMLQGERLVAHDNVQSIGLSHELQQHYEKTGKINRWTNSVFSGMPAFRIWGSSKLSEVSKVISLFKVSLPKPMSNLFFYLIGFYILMVAMGMHPIISVLGSIAFAFGTYNIILLEAGHSTKATTIATIPMVLAGAYLIYRGKYFLGGALAALFLAMAVRSNHVQIGYYIAIILVFYAINEAIFFLKEKKLKEFMLSSTVLLIAGLMALAANTSYLWTTYEYSKESIRGGRSELAANKDKNEKGGLDTEYAWRWSYGIKETFTLLVPNMYGGATVSNLGENSNTYKELTRNRVPVNQAKQFASGVPTYHGDQPFTSGPVYLGAIIFFLCILGIIIVPGRQKYWLIILSILTIFLSWGKNWTDFNMIFFENLPLYNKFRVPAMALVMTCFAMLWIAILALRELTTSDKKKEMIRALQIAGGICAGLLLILFFVASGMDYSSPRDAQFSSNNQQWIVDAMMKDRASMFKGDIFRSFIFIALAAAAIFVYLKGKLKKEFMLAGLAVLILVDLWGVDKRFLDASDFKDAREIDRQFKPSQASLQIMKDTDPHYRVFNSTNDPFNDAMTSYFHKSVGGYHAAKMIRYQDLIERHLGPGNMRVFNMLNTKYFISKGQNNSIEPRTNPNALGNAWFVREQQIVENADAEIEALNTFDPAETVIVDKRYADYLDGYAYSKGPGNSIELVNYDTDHMTYRSKANTDQLAVFSEIYYTGKDWKAYIDGEFIPHIRVDYVLRALKVPAGEHTIEFKFLPKSFYVGRKISSISFYLLLILIIAGIGYEFKPKKLSE